MVNELEATYFWNTVSEARQALRDRLSLEEMRPVLEELEGIALNAIYQPFRTAAWRMCGEIQRIHQREIIDAHRRSGPGMLRGPGLVANGDPRPGRGHADPQDPEGEDR